MRGDWEAAIADLDESLERSPDPLNSAFAMGWLGFSHREKGDPDRAIALLEQSVASMTEFHFQRNVCVFGGFLAGAYRSAGQDRRGPRGRRGSALPQPEAGLPLVHRARATGARAGRPRGRRPGRRREPPRRGPRGVHRDGRRSSRPPSRVSTWPSSRAAGSGTTKRPGSSRSAARASPRWAHRLIWRARSRSRAVTLDGVRRSRSALGQTENQRAEVAAASRPPVPRRALIALSSGSSRGRRRLTSSWWAEAATGPRAATPPRQLRRVSAAPGRTRSRAAAAARRGARGGAAGGGPPALPRGPSQPRGGGRR